MKKLVAISVLLAGLATAVFAQDGGWSNDWTLGFYANYITNVFYAAKATGSNEATQKTTPMQYSENDADGKAQVTAQGVRDDANATYSREWGKSGKGVTHFFPNQRPLDGIGGDYRAQVMLENSGENYAMRFTIALDNWGNAGNVMTFLSQGPGDDWGIKGSAGIFSIGIGAWATEAAWVGTNAIWGSWIGWNDLNRFGVWRYDGAPDGGWIHSDHFRTFNQWGNPFSVGIALGDSYKFTLGYRIDSGFKAAIGDPTDSRASMNGTFMLSGSPVDMINFDLFYSIQGQDQDTYALPRGNFYYNDPTASWKNLLGAYVQVNGLENLFLSLGYTANFVVFEAGGFVDPKDGDLTAIKKVNYTAPFYSGVDLRVGFSGIDKIGLKFFTNVSFASTKGDTVEGDKHKGEIKLLFDEKPTTARSGAAIGRFQDWFHWQAILASDLGFIDGVGLEATLGTSLGIFTDAVNNSITPKVEAGEAFTKIKTDSTDTETKNEFRATVGAKYGVGNVSLGIALYLSWENETIEHKSTVTHSYTPAAGTTGSFSDNIVEKTSKDVTNTVKFGIPITVRVSF